MLISPENEPLAKIIPNGFGSARFNKTFVELMKAPAPQAQ
jgi:hypothetical protein